MRKFFAILTAVTIAILAAGVTAKANSSMGLPQPGVRSSGMGSAFVAVANDVNAIAWNPAGLGFVKDRQLQVETTDLYGFGITYNYLAFAMKNYGFGWGHIDADSFLMGGGGDYGQDMFVFSGAQSVDPQTFVGASLKWHKIAYSPPSDPTRGLGVDEIPKSLESRTADGFSLDLGVLYLADENTTMGISIYDLFGETKARDSASTGDNIRPKICLGVARKSDESSTLAIQISDVGKESTVHLGIEKKLQSELTLRGGIDDETISAGLGFTYQQWELNYSFQNKPSAGLDKTQKFGAVVHF